jgi:hypothetical protein
VRRHSGLEFDARYDVDGRRTVRSRYGFGRPMNVEQLSWVLADLVGGVPVVVEDSKMGWQGNPDEAQSTGPQRCLVPEGP